MTTAAQPFRVSIRLPHCRCATSVQSSLAVAEAAEALGFWGVSVEDHLLAHRLDCATPVAHQGRAFLESLQMLAFIAGRTRRVRLLTGVLQLPYRHPVLLAKETMTLDNISDGRLIVGVGVGALRRRQQAEGVDLSAYAAIANREYDAVGVTGNRGAITDEYIEALTAIWTDEDASYHGTYVNFDGIDMFPRTVQQPRPPIWVGGRSEAALRRVAYLADGWYPSQTSAAFLRTGRARVEELAAESGRPIADFGPQNEMYLLRDDAKAHEMMRRHHRWQFVSDEAMFEQTFTGDPARVVDQILAHIEAGATFIDLRPLGISLEDTLAQLHLFAEEVMPALAEATADAAPALDAPIVPGAATA